MSVNYISTRGGSQPIGFSDAVMTGLARDGGLFLPDHIPDVSSRLSGWASLDYVSLAAEILNDFVDIREDVLNDLLQKSYADFDHSEITPTVQVGDLHILELFHGPTLAFKDLALQFLGRVFEHLLDSRTGLLNIVGATSGDTGSAAIYGVRGRDRIRIFVMHPNGRISPAQERQMTTVLDPNVYNLGIEGTFDDCQRILKELFADLAFKDEHMLGSVNSINWARVLSQIVYYFYSGLQVMTKTGADRVDFSVPTGNFGDIFAGYLAARMGLPIGRLVLATNENDILCRFFTTGIYRRGEVAPTLSPSMDIQVASNFERYLYYQQDENADRVRDMMNRFAQGEDIRVSPQEDGSIDGLIVAGRGTRQDTLQTIRDIHRQHGYLLDPHTAVGVHVAQANRRSGVPMICLATAHPAKFADAIEQAVGEDLAHHPSLDALEGAPTRKTVLPAQLDAVRDFIAEAVSRRESS